MKTVKALAAIAIVLPTLAFAQANTPGIDQRQANQERRIDQGIASGSLHGWLWLPCAFAGNVIGTYLRPAFGLGVERSALPKC